jgi:hypothetical protein
VEIIVEIASIINIDFNAIEKFQYPPFAFLREKANSAEIITKRPVLTINDIDITPQKEFKSLTTNKTTNPRIKEIIPKIMP